MLALGSYPSTSLADARTQRNEARAMIENGVDPSVRRKLKKLALEASTRMTFKLIAAEHVSNLEANGASPVTVAKHRWLLEVIAAPIANRPINDVTSAELLDLLKRVEKSGRRETAKRLRATISTFFPLAIASSLDADANIDPLRVLTSALAPVFCTGR
jgi:integrase